MENTAIVVLLGALCITTDFCKGETCDMNEVDRCLGELTELSTSMALNPLQINLLSSIQQTYCGQGYEDCLRHVVSGCSDRQLAPYKTIVTSVKLVCNQDIDYTSTCLREQKVQHHLKYCFQLFKADIDHVVGDTMLTTMEVNRGLCRSYDYVSTCVFDITKDMCNLRDTVYINTLVRGSMEPTQTALQC